jgi:hypothetical protein
VGGAWKGELCIISVCVWYSPIENAINQTCHRSNSRILVGIPELNKCAWHQSPRTAENNKLHKKILPNIAVYYGLEDASLFAAEIIIFI